MIRFLKEGLPVDKVDFGITEAGHSNRITVSYKNEYESKVELVEPKIHSDVKLLEYTKNLKVGEVGTAVLEFSPSLNTKKGLEDGVLAFKVLIG